MENLRNRPIDLVGVKAIYSCGELVYQDSEPTIKADADRGHELSE